MIHEPNAGPPQPGRSGDVVRFSTDEVPRRERFDYWVGTLCERLFEMKTSTTSTRDFSCSLTAANLDGLVVTHARGSSQTSYRTRHLVAKSQRRAFHLVVDFAQPWIAVRNGDHFRMKPGDLIVLDTEEVHGGMWKDACSVTNLLLPPAWLLTWISKPALIVGRRIDHQTGWGAALSAFVSQLTPRLVSSTTVPLGVIGDHLGSLLAMVVGERDAPSRSHVRREVNAEKNLRRVTETIRERISQADLDAAAVAETMGVPARVLHGWLREREVTFGALLQRARATAASDMLCSRTFDDLSAAEIGQRVGICSASNLGRVLKRHFGESPMLHRRASIA